MSQSQIELTRNDRIEFIGGCVFVAVFAAPISYAFLTHLLTGDKASMAGCGIVALIAAVVTGLWAGKARPSRMLVTGVLVVLPILVGLFFLACEAISLFSRF